MGKELDIYTGPGTELEVAPEIIDAEIVDDVVAASGPYVELSENNSGGGWWLSDEDWKALERAGWVVDWAENRLKSNTEWLRKSVSQDEHGVWRYMGALAHDAKRYGVSLRVAMAEFQDITGQDPDEEGCDCCGQPHYFSARDAEGNYVSN